MRTPELLAEREGIQSRLSAQLHRDRIAEASSDPKVWEMGPNDEDIYMLDKELNRLNRLAGLRDCLNCGKDYSYRRQVCPHCGDVRCR